MNKKELIDRVVDETGLAKKDVQLVTESFLLAISDALANDEEVKILGFGTFSVRNRRQRVSTSVHENNKKIDIPEGKVVRFKCGKSLKRYVQD